MSFSHIICVTKTIKFNQGILHALQTHFLAIISHQLELMLGVVLHNEVALSGSMQVYRTLC